MTINIPRKKMDEHMSLFPILLATDPWEDDRCSVGPEISQPSFMEAKRSTPCPYGWYSSLGSLVVGADSPGFLQMTHTSVCILSIVSDAGNPGIRSESDPDAEDTAVCGDAVLWWAPPLLSCAEDDGGFSSRWDSALKLRVSWRVRGGTPAVR